MNNPLNSIAAFAKQASSTSRAAIGRGFDTGSQILRAGSYGRAALKAAGIGALAGGAIGAGASKATGDRSMSRDVAVGSILGALGGAGYSMRGPGMGIIDSMRGRGFGPVLPRGAFPHPNPKAPSAAVVSHATTGVMHGPSMAGGFSEWAPGARSGTEAAAYYSRLRNTGPVERMNRGIAEKLSGMSANREQYANLFGVTSKPAQAGTRYNSFALPSKYRHVQIPG